MKVLVDTPIWSLALRRKSRPENAAMAPVLASLIDDKRASSCDDRPIHETIHNAEFARHLVG